MESMESFILQNVLFVSYNLMFIVSFSMLCSLCNIIVCLSNLIRMIFDLFFSY